MSTAKTQAETVAATPLAALEKTLELKCLEVEVKDNKEQQKNNGLSQQ